VLVPAHVLDEILAHARQAGDVETGGILVGHLRRTPGASRELYVEVTAQVPALHAESQTAKLTFTAETWSEAQSFLELRGRDELMVGWWHLHPHFCKACPPESRSDCVFARDFFSTEDVHLHRTCFSRAWQIALLASDHGGPEPSIALFSWRNGSVVQRGFDVLADESRDATDSNGNQANSDTPLAARIASCDTDSASGEMLRAADPEELPNR
jgi:proteasome lid subunit RPN8/RPN11